MSILPEKAEATGSGGRFFAAECDLGKDDDIRKTFDWIRNHPDLGQVDVCICNAGYRTCYSRPRTPTPEFALVRFLVLRTWPEYDDNITRVVTLHLVFRGAA